MNHTGLLDMDCIFVEHSVIALRGTFTMFQVPTTSAFGGILLQSPSSLSIDQREMFSLYLFPGPGLSKKVGFKSAGFCSMHLKVMNGCFEYNTSFLEMLNFCFLCKRFLRRKCFLLSI